MSPFDFNFTNAAAAVFSLAISGIFMATAIVPATPLGVYV
jgi:hypothetical protein